MNSSFDPVEASIDGLIQWLREQRRHQPAVLLSELVDVSRVPIDRLTDLACIDLIERKRLAIPTRVEDLLRELPVLAQSETAILDLLDAEICVRVENDETIETAEYHQRFPELAHAIDAIAKIEQFAGGIIPSAKPDPNWSKSNGGIQSRSIDQCHALVDIVQPPNWFTGEQVQSSGDRSCLIRGRDCRQNSAVAMKVVRLTHSITKVEIQSLLDSVETASLVRHPAWVTPDVAAIGNQSLAVIRPWIFGMRWDQARRHATTRTRLFDIARIGYALQAVHDTFGKNGSASHGGLHLNNVLVDSQGQVRIIDALVSVQPAAGDIFGAGLRPKGDNLDLCDQRRSSDVRSLCAFARMITGSGFSNDSNLRKQASAVDRLCQKLIDQPGQPNACGLVADALTSLANGNFRESNDSLVPTQGRFSALFRRSIGR